MALYLKRIATVVSLKQLAEDSSPSSPAADVHGGAAAAAAPDAAVADCSGTRFPRYSFVAKPKRKVKRTRSFQVICAVPDVDDSSSLSSHSGTSSEDDDATVPTAVEKSGLTSRSLMDTILMALWEDCQEQGLFRYDVTACPTKVLPGIYGFVAQLNEGRATKKRATEFRVDQVVQDFDPSKFNFTKAYQREVLFQFEPGTGKSGGPKVEDGAVAGASPSVVVINVSPIEYGHVLLVPKVLSCIPQLVEPSTMLLALRFAAEADNPYFRVGFNSLGAYATINHLHFQAYYLAAPFPCERAPTKPLILVKRKHPSVQISRLVNYPVNGFVIEGSDQDEIANVVGQACVKMQQRNIPHNFLISDAGTRVFLWPQCFAEKQAKGQVAEDLLETGVNPACWEIAGHMVLKRKEDYDNITQALAWRLLAEVSLTEERFLEVADLCFA